MIETKTTSASMLFGMKDACLIAPPSGARQGVSHTEFVPNNSSFLIGQVAHQWAQTVIKNAASFSARKDLNPAWHIQ